MPGDKLKNSVGLRLFLIGVLSLVLLIPAMMIQGLITEREQRRNSAVFEVSDKWGRPQTLAGPILTVPYKKLIKDEKGNLTPVVEYAHFLPERLSINAELFPEIRYRGIYEVVLYNSKLQLRGNFSLLDFNQFSILAENILWKDSFLALGLGDLKGIREAVKINFNGAGFVANPGIESKDVLEIGISVKPNLRAPSASYEFAIDLDLNGSGAISFVPVGKETSVKISSPWGNPSFVGEFLPVERQVQSNHFNAEWKVLHLNRNYPQQWLGSRHHIMDSSFGVELLLPIDEYQKTMRTAKYAIMFIALTFLAFFLTEVLNKKVIHPIQYILIGLALILFYTLLLSFSEHIKFNSAYLLSSLAIIALVTAYTKSVLSNNPATAIIAGILIVLYGFLYIILQLQDYALLLGSVGLFIILAIVMYVTRKIDWFAIGKLASESQK
ncbi:MAG: cell envelope integrity protein CreD [candidate division KSB1 bacterium]|nr:cell envelope integrity protein CreD [candidate division KSB1 bacterium]MDZ7367357.1 cell envelope integrity protein CreD [candidate division KSB1 bacterium]MDZ7405238.1 cell envelope integrity protein CreD [candidate division KSB1 bacterium]